MRAIWKGAVSFGLVNVPVRLYAATQEHDIRFHQVHRADGGRIKMKRTCSVDGEEVSYDEIAKGFEADDGRLVVLDDEDLESLPVSSSREIDVVEFVPAEQVDPILFGRSYYLEPDARAVKPYTLLREALAETERVGVVKVALRQREALAVLRVRDNVIMLQTLLWPDEVRAPEFDVLDADVELRPQELTMAASLVESLAADFDPDQFEDAYQSAMRELVERKLEGAPLAPAAAEDAGTGGGEVVDLLTALQRSVERARAGRGQTPAFDVSSTPEEKTPPRKAPAANRAAQSEEGDEPEEAKPAKSTTARKTAAKKTAAKKTATRRSA
jgi:DNA end-binding protein Ku